MKEFIEFYNHNQWIVYFFFAGFTFLVLNGLLFCWLNWYFEHKNVRDTLKYFKQNGILYTYECGWMGTKVSALPAVPSVGVSQPPLPKEESTSSPSRIHSSL